MAGLSSRTLAAPSVSLALRALSLAAAVTVGACGQAGAQANALREREFGVDVREAPGFKKVEGGFAALTDCVDLTGGSGSWGAERFEQVIWGPAGGMKDGEPGRRCVADYRMLCYSYTADRAVNGWLWARLRQPDATHCLYAAGAYNSGLRAVAHRAGAVESVAVLAGPTGAPLVVAAHSNGDVSAYRLADAKRPAR